MNQDLFFDQKNFISASRASQETGYSQDYLGQLCRAKKIPARMVGRTWYVEHDAILSHKANPTSRKKRKSNIVIEAISKSPLTTITGGSVLRKDDYVSPFIFQKDSSPVFPHLAKRASSGAAVNKQKTNNKILTLSVFVLLFVSSFSWMKVLSPRASEITSKEIQHILTISAQNIRHNGLLSAVNQAVELEKKPITGTGLVTFPDIGSHDQAVATVKSSFSDDASVNFDKDGTSGIITPVFHSGDDTDHYAFVMVPVKQTQ